MRYSPNLNIIIKAIEKAASFVSRDFTELENLQSNPASANKFASSCYRKVKKTLFEDLAKMRPQYDIFFADGEMVKGVGGSGESEYSYKIFPIDGLDNLTRANPDFTIAVALEHVGKNGQKEVISVAVNKVIGNEIYYCEKGFGSYINNRRSRTSKRQKGEAALTFAEDHNVATKFFPEKNITLRDYGCRTLSIAYLAASRLDCGVFPNVVGDVSCEFLRPFFLLVKEAGGNVAEKEAVLTVG